MVAPRPARSKRPRAWLPAACAAALLAAGGAGVRAADADADCGLEDPAIAAAAPRIPARPRALRAPGALPPPVMRIAPRGGQRSLGHRPLPGALTGRTVYLSAGHGWYWSAPLGRWAAQRGNTHDLLEDLVSTETIAHHLIPLLHRMGAYVVPVRESDTNAAMVIVDDADPGLALEGLDATSTGEGFGPPPAIVTDATNPFADGGSRTVAADAGGQAVWTFDVPADGDYTVYASWVQAPERAPAAHYVVRHAGGEAHFQVDQRRHGSTWVLLGRFPFRAGADPATGALVLVADGAAGTTLSIDAARIGGGSGRIDRGGGASARPRYEEAARYAAQWNGAPPSVWDYADADNNDDVGTRSRFSAWDHEDGEDAIYVAWHTNAPSPARGTSSFAYGPSSYGPLSEFSGVPGSLELMDAIHAELVADLRAAWDPAWQDRGQHTAYFGEVNPNHNPEMPATLIEVAFHATQDDAAALREPRFRYLAARAIAHGIARYFATRDGAPLVLPPEPPTALRMTQAAGGLVVRWSAPAADPAGGDAPTAYRVYLSRDGQAFDGGREVDGTELAIAAAEAGAAPLYVRVASVNAGGESRPSPVVGGRRAPSGQARVLVVAGFDRLTGDMLVREDLSAFGLATLDRAPEDRLNDGSYVGRHGRALDAAGVSFDTVTRDALATVELAGYAAVDWLAGRDAVGGESAILAAYLDGGGRVLASGSELVRTLDDGLRDRLGVDFVATDTSAMAAGAAAPFDGLSAFAIGDDAPGGYRPPTLDALAPRGTAIGALAFEGGATAATFRDDAVTGARAVVFGFPLEAVADPDVRAELVARALAAFDVTPDPVRDDELGGCCGTQRAHPDPLAIGLAVLGLLRLPRRRRR